MDRKAIIKRKLKIFKKNVSRDFPVKKMIFFGSRAKGKPKRYSDIDLVIVSPKFRRLDFVQRGAKMYDYWDLNYPVDFLCFSPEEFDEKKKQMTVVKEAIETGIEI